MPKLLTFGVCHQLTIDRDTGAISMIHLVNNLQVLIRKDQKVTPDTNFAFEWAVVLAWLREDQDVGKTFDLRNVLVKPNGTTTGNDETTVTFGADPESRIITTSGKATVFPAGQVGIVTVRVEMRESGSGQDWTPVAEYPIEVVHQFQETVSLVMQAPSRVN